MSEPKPNQRLAPVPVRLTPEERERINQAANASGNTRSGFLRHAALTMANQVLGAPVYQGTTEAPAHASGPATS
jgi:uncharacterized protein (DUF1778 family)